MKSETIKNMGMEEYLFNRPNRAKLLIALAYIISQAESDTNEQVYFTKSANWDLNKGIVIENINALYGMSIELGTDFIAEYTLRGMQSVTQNKDGYCMSVLTTLDLNSATIHDLSELVYRIRQINN